MNLEQLNSFITVAQHMNFTKAADALFVSHSTISRQIASLEKDLGVSLLIRDNRSVRLTEAGTILLDRGERLFGEIADIENSVRKAGSGLSGSLLIASLNFYHEQLYSLYKAFCARYPDVVFTIQHKDIGFIAEQIASERSDIGIAFSYEWDEYKPDFEVYKLYQERFCVVVAQDHPLSGRGSVRLSELRQEKLLFLNHLQFNFFKRFDSEMGIIPGQYDDIVQPTSGESMIMQIRAGLGISVLPRPLAEEFSSGCSILEIEGCDTGFDVIMLWKKNSINPALRLFLATADAFFPGVPGIIK